jgi:hypothetical protein
MRQIGLAGPEMPGSAFSTVSALTALFASAGLEGVASRQIEATTTFRDFDEYWHSQTPSYSPTTRIISSLAPHRRSALVKALENTLPTSRDGTISYAARANAVKAQVPQG